MNRANNITNLLSWQPLIYYASIRLTSVGGSPEVANEVMDPRLEGKVLAVNAGEADLRPPPPPPPPPRGDWRPFLVAVVVVLALLWQLLILC